MSPDPKLVFGDLVHQALALYYIPGRKRGTHPAITFQVLIDKLEQEVEDKLWADDKFMTLLELGVPMLERYVEHWKEADKEYKIVASEQIFQVPIGSIGGRRHAYVGTIDGVWMHLPTKKLRFAEHKTTTEISRNALPMDEQVGAYWTFGPRWLRLKGILKSGDRLDGILYNWLRKAVPDPDAAYDNLGRRLNKDGSISKRQAPPYFERQLTFRGDVEAERVKERVRNEAREMLEAKSDPSKVYKNPGPQFRPNCQFCAFRDPCELHETGNDWQTYLDAAFKTWNPYSAHDRAERK